MILDALNAVLFHWCKSKNRIDVKKKIIFNIVQLVLLTPEVF